MACHKITSHENQNYHEKISTDLDIFEERYSSPIDEEQN
jgi:hypothetical protein